MQCSRKLVYGLCSGIFLVLCLYAWQIQNASVPVFLLNQVSSSQFSIFIKNPTTQQIVIEKIHSRLGAVQFHFEVNVGNKVIEIRRRDKWINELGHYGGPSNPILIPSGGEAKIKANLADFTWVCSEEHENEIGNAANWESIRVVYSGSLKPFHSGDDLLVGDFHSNWISTCDSTSSDHQKSLSKSVGNEQDKDWTRALFRRSTRTK